jgi:hypothetical protein
MSSSRVIVAAGVALALALAFVTNPSAERHRAAIKEQLGERSPLARVLGVGAVAAFASSYHSWGVCSYTTVNDRTLSIGAFGIVHVKALTDGR